MKNRVFLIEDPGTLPLLQHVLAQAGYAVSAFSDDSRFLHAPEKLGPCLFVVHVAGWARNAWVCDYIRAHSGFSSVPILCVAANSTEHDRVREATDDLMDENDLGRPFMHECLIEDPAAITSTPNMESAVRKWVGGVVLDDATFGQVMDSVRARYTYGRKRTPEGQIRGFIGVRLREAS